MAKKGSQYKCPECGAVVMITETCDCTPCDLICCGVPMEEYKPKAKPKAKAKAKAKTKK
jgi:hypothetical protein